MNRHLRTVADQGPINDYAIEVRPQDFAAADDALMYWIVERRPPGTIVVSDCPLDTIWEALGEAGIVENVYRVSDITALPPNEKNR